MLGSPVDYGNVAAVFRAFMERLIGYACWPWRTPPPKSRKKASMRKAALVASSATPGFLIPLLTGTGRALRTAKMLDAKPIGSLRIGLSAQEPNHPLSAKNRQHARRMGVKPV